MNYEKSKCISQTRCPRCAKDGHDKQGDNLAIYSDGSQYCFACGYVHHDISNYIQSARNRHIVSLEDTIKTVRLPEDISIDYPQDTIKWINQYDLLQEDLINHNVLWSDSMSRLIFPMFSEQGCIFYTARYFNLVNSDMKQSCTSTGLSCKWLARGNKPLHHLVGKNTVVLVEDILSAIKLNNLGYGSVCLFGTAFLNKLDILKKITSKYKSCYLWLDPDKFKESIIMIRHADSHGLDIRLLQSEHDPKEHSFDYINEKLI